MDARFFIFAIVGASIVALAESKIPSDNWRDPAETSPASVTPSAVPGDGQMQRHQSFTTLPESETNKWMTNAASGLAETNLNATTNLTRSALTNRNNWWWQRH